MIEEVLNAETPNDSSLLIEEGEQTELIEVLMNGDTFLLPVQDVAGILRPIDLTPVPMAPDHMLGVANVRGQIVCIIDPGKVLHLKQTRSEKTEDTRYLILRHSRMHLGIWVDAVSELYRVAKNSLPQMGAEQDGYLQGEMVFGDKKIKLLNTQVLFN